MDGIKLLLDFSKINDLKDFDRSTRKYISDGHFANAYKYQNTADGKIYCVKIYKDQLRKTEDQIKFCREVSLLQQTNCPSVLSLYGYNQSCALEEYKPIIITKYYPTDLDKCIDENYDMDISQRYLILLGIAEGMKYLHSIKVVHRDLKPKNIFLDENYYPVIGDLGQSRDDQQKMDSVVGTFGYQAPEQYQDKYNNKTDIFSFAITAYQIITWGAPYKTNKTRYGLAREIENGLRPDRVKIENDYIKNCLNEWWSADPEDRPTFDQIVKEIKSKNFRLAMNADDEKVSEYLALFGDSLPTGTEVADAQMNVDKLKQKANQGDLNSLVLLGDLFYNGDVGIDKNLAESLDFYERAARLNNTYSMRQCAKILLVLHPNDENKRKEAVDYLKNAINEGDFNALKDYVQGDFLTSFDGKMKDIKKDINDNIHKNIVNGVRNVTVNDTLKWMNAYEVKNNLLLLSMYNSYVELGEFFRICADKDNIQSIVTYALMNYERSIPQKKGKFEKEEDLLKYFKETAFTYFKKAADLHDVDGLNMTALMLMNGEIPSENDGDMTKYFMDGISQKNTYSMLNYAIALLNGDYSEINEDRIINYFKESADLGNVNAMLFYATILTYKYIGPNYNLAEANKLIEKASKAEVSEKDAEYMFNYSSMIFKGKIKKFKSKSAVLFLKIAADKGNIYAKYYYSLILHEGEYTDKDKKGARKLFIEAYSGGNDKAFNEFTSILNKYGTTVYSKKNKKCIDEALDNASIKEMINYSKLLNNVDDEESLRYLAKASRKGSKEAKKLFCFQSGIFYKLFYELEEIRAKYNIDPCQHVYKSIADTCSDENKAKLINCIKKKKINNVEGVIDDVKSAYSFIYGSELEDDKIRQVINDNLKDSDFADA